MAQDPTQLPKGYKLPGQGTPQAAPQGAGGGLPSGYKLPSAAAPALVTPPPPTATISANPTGWMHPLNTLRLWEARLQSHLQNGVSPGVANFMGSPELGLMKAAEGGMEVGSGHPLHGSADVLRGVGQAATIPGAMLGAFAPGTLAAAAPVMLAQEGTERGLKAVGVPERTASDIGTVTAGGLGMFGKVLPGGNEEGMTFEKGINKLEKALAPGRTTRFLNTRSDLEAVAPDLRAIAKTGTFKPRRPWRPGGLPLRDTANTLAAAMHQRASDVFEQRAKAMEPFANVYTETAPIEQNIRGLITPGMRQAARHDPDALRTVRALRREANSYGGEHIPLSQLESLRQRFRKELGNTDFFKTQKTDVQDLAEARHRGAVKAVEDAMQQLQGPGAESAKALNMRGGRLDTLGDRLAVRAIGSSFREPGALNQMLRGSHAFISAHGGMPYIGVFANPTALAEDMVNPRGTNALVRRAMKDFGRTSRQTPLHFLAQRFALLAPREKRELPEENELPEDIRAKLFQTLGLRPNPTEGIGLPPFRPDLPPPGARRLLPPGR